MKEKTACKYYSVQINNGTIKKKNLKTNEEGKWGGRTECWDKNERQH